MRSATVLGVITWLACSTACGSDDAASNTAAGSSGEIGTDKQAATRERLQDAMPHAQSETSGGAAGGNDTPGKPTTTPATSSADDAGRAADSAGAAGSTASGQDSNSAGSSAASEAAGGTGGAGGSGGATSAQSGAGSAATGGDGGASGSAGQTATAGGGAGGSSASADVCTEDEFTKDCGSDCPFAPDSIDCNTVCAHLIPACEAGCSACQGMTFTALTCMLQCETFKGFTCGSRLLGCAAASETCDEELACIAAHH